MMDVNGNLNENKYITTPMFNLFGNAHYRCETVLLLLSSLCFLLTSFINGDFFYISLIPALVCLTIAALLILLKSYSNKIDENKKFDVTIGFLKKLFQSLKIVYAFLVFAFFIGAVTTGFVFDKVLQMIEKSTYIINILSENFEKINGALESMGFSTFETVNDLLANDDVKMALEVGLTLTFIVFALFFMFMRSFSKKASETVLTLKSMIKNESSEPELSLKINYYLWSFGIFCFIIAIPVFNILLSAAFILIGIASVIFARILKRYRDKRLYYILKNKLI